MSIGSSMASAWHNHPYIIMGVGGAIVLYFLWPSSSGGSSAPPNTDYANQLAAETQLSQTQLAEQAQAAISHDQARAADDAAVAQAQAASNSAIAQSNAAAIISYNQTEQAYAQYGASVANTQLQANSLDFAALIAGLTGFTNATQTTLQDNAAIASNTWLAAGGAQFSSKENGNDFSSSASRIAQYFGGFWGAGNNQANTGAGMLADKERIKFGTDVSNFDNILNNINTPFTANENLLASLWASAISSYNTTAGAAVPQLPILPGTNSQGQLPGSTLPVTGAAH